MGQRDDTLRLAPHLNRAALAVAGELCVAGFCLAFGVVGPVVGVPIIVVGVVIGIFTFVIRRTPAARPGA